MKPDTTLKTRVLPFTAAALALYIAYPAGAHAQPAPGDARKAVSLAELWTRAERHAPAIKARLKEIEAVDQAIAALPRPYLPSVGVRLGYGGAINMEENKHGPLARVSAEWTIWDGGRTGYARTLMKKTSEVAGGQGVLFAYELKKKIASGFCEAARLAESIRDDESRIQDLDVMKKLLAPRLRIGRIGISDIEDIIIRIEEASGKIKTDRLIVLMKRKQLAMLAGGSGDDAVVVPDLADFSDPGAPAAKGKSSPETPAVFLARRQVSLLEARREHRKRELYWPVLGIELYGGYGPYLDAIDPARPEIGAGAAFRIPLISNGDREKEINSLTAGIEAARLDLAQAELNGKVAVESLSKTIPALEDRAGALEKGVGRSRRNLKAAFREFSRGLKSPADMLAAVQTLYDMKQKFNDVRTELFLLKAELYLMESGFGGPSTESLK